MNKMLGLIGVVILNVVIGVGTTVISKKILDDVMISKEQKKWRKAVKDNIIRIK